MIRTSGHRLFARIMRLIQEFGYSNTLTRTALSVARSRLSHGLHRSGLEVSPGPVMFIGQSQPTMQVE